MNIIDFIRENQAYFEDFITRSTYHSNGIEGNTLSYAETYAIIFNDNEYTVNAKPRELYEAINHKYAIDYVLRHIGDDLNEVMIKEIGITMNKNINEISGFRTVPVIIKSVEHIPPKPAEVPQAMMYFVYNYNHTNYESIYEKLAENHIAFERIHPFSDGNGRTGRLLINYELIKNNFAPIVIPKEERTQYFKFLAGQDSKGLAKYFEELQGKEVTRIEQFRDSIIDKIKSNKEIVHKQDIRLQPKQDNRER